MRKLLIVALASILFSAFVPAQAATTRRAQVAVIKISDDQVLALLDAEQKAQWAAAQEALKKIEADKRSAQWLLDRTNDGPVKMDLSGTHKTGRQQMQAAVEREKQTEATLQALRVEAQKKADYIAIHGPEYAYTKDQVNSIAWANLCESAVEVFYNRVREQSYDSIYFSKLSVWKDGTYKDDAQRNQNLTYALLKADGRNYTLLVAKAFVVELKDGRPSLSIQEAPAPADPEKTALIVAEIVEAANMATIVSLRAIDYTTWKIVENMTFILTADGQQSTLETVFADKAQFAQVLAAQPNTFYFQLSFAEPKTDLSRFTSVLYKASAHAVPGQNLSDGDFLALAYGVDITTDAQVAPAGINVFWKLAPAVPVIEPPQAEVKKDLRRLSPSKRAQLEAEEKAKAEQAALNPPSLPPVLSTPLEAYNVLVQTSVDVGKFEVRPVSAPTTPEGPAAAVSSESAK